MLVELTERDWGGHLWAKPLVDGARTRRACRWNNTRSADIRIRSEGAVESGAPGKNVVETEMTACGRSSS